MAKWASIFTFVWAFQIVSSTTVKGKFRNYQVFEVGGVTNFENEEDFFTKLNLPSDDSLEILHEDAIQGTVQVLVRPELQERFLEGVRGNQLPYEVIIEDIETLIESSHTPRSEIIELNGESTFDRYMEFHEIQNYLQTLSKSHGEKVKLKNIGKSILYENITMVTITDYTRLSKGRVKPIVFMEAGAHAREWLSISSAIYMIEMLAKTSSPLTSDVEWRIVPVSNPDGYKYTWSDDRMWRKNRRRHPNSGCFGVDLNRNFNSSWGKKGSSGSKCSAIYRGINAFSEPETRVIRDAILDVKTRVKAFVSLHCYGQLILYPPGIPSRTLSLKSQRIVNSIGQKMSRAIQTSADTKYTVGSPAKLLYHAAGLSMDWAMLRAGVPLAFTYEMRDKGKYGFLLPKNQIASAVKDIWVGMNTLYKEVKDLASTRKLNEVLLKSGSSDNGTVPVFSLFQEEGQQHLLSNPEPSEGVDENSIFFNEGGLSDEGITRLQNVGITLQGLTAIGESSQSETSDSISSTFQETSGTNSLIIPQGLIQFIAYSQSGTPNRKPVTSQGTTMNNSSIIASALSQLTSTSQSQTSDNESEAPTTKGTSDGSSDTTALEDIPESPDTTVSEELSDTTTETSVSEGTPENISETTEFEELSTSTPETLTSVGTSDNPDTSVVEETSDGSPDTVIPERTSDSSSGTYESEKISDGSSDNHVSLVTSTSNPNNTVSSSDDSSNTIVRELVTSSNPDTTVSSSDSSSDTIVSELVASTSSPATTVSSSDGSFDTAVSEETSNISSDATVFEGSSDISDTTISEGTSDSSPNASASETSSDTNL